MPTLYATRRRATRRHARLKTPSGKSSRDEARALQTQGTKSKLVVHAKSKLVVHAKSKLVVHAKIKLVVEA